MPPLPESCQDAPQERVGSTDILGALVFLVLDEAHTTIPEALRYPLLQPTWDPNN